MIEANIVNNKVMVSESEWQKHIDSLKTKGKATKKQVMDKIVEAVKKRIPKEKFGIFFSGGIDSSLIALICKQQKADFICYAVGMEGASDLEYAKKTAKLIGVELKFKTMSLKQAETIIKETTKIVGPDVMKVGVGSVVYSAAELGKKDGIKLFFSGLGSEEIFAGYERHENVKDVNEECWNGLKLMYNRDFLRDYEIAKKLKIDVLVPFLDSELIETAMHVDGKKKISDEYKKVILREIAEEIGLPKEIAWRKKKAAQYGSKIQKALRKLTKKDGFQRISAYLFQFYTPTKIKLGALVSSGKDSVYAMYKMMKLNHPIACMITMKSSNLDSFMYHTPAIEMVKLQSKAFGIPLLEQETKGVKEKELEDLKKALENAKKKYKIEGIITGALYSNYQRERIEKIAEELNLLVYSPLWHMDQEGLLREIISTGFKFILTKIAAEGLDKSWLNHVITNSDIEKLVALNKKIGINVAFEGGEAESLMIDGPIFDKPIKITDSFIEEESKIVAEMKIRKAKLS